MTTIESIDAAASELSRAREKLETLLTGLADNVRALERQRLPAIKRAFETAVARQDGLTLLIDANRGLFERPKSRVVLDLKFGLRKGRGGIEFEDEDQVIGLIEQKLPEKKDLLIKTEKRILKGGLNQLDVKELRSIGCTVEETGDVVFVQGIDSALRKQLDRMLKTATTDDNITRLAA